MLLLAQVEVALRFGPRRGSRPKRVNSRSTNISLVVTPELAYSVDIERTKVRLANAQELRLLALRVTSIFRLDGRRLEATYIAMPIHWSVLQTRRWPLPLGSAEEPL